ncbi:Phosphatase and actin regulator 3 [Merluccius polli]|uniref:Phosphatase and actin regulator 3 n=1 Tax=Merluccius polli TaxID=89951 RepID=A0AA47NC83_MERPO|nr:Phosphatase and actin regulator 3 [Merluccius polli]
MQVDISQTPPGPQHQVACRFSSRTPLNRAAENTDKTHKHHQDKAEGTGMKKLPVSMSKPTETPSWGHADVMDQQRALHSGCLVAGVRTPPVRRSSKLASLGRIFKPWKWRKKKSEKLKPSTALEKRAAGRQSREDLARRGLGEPDTESDFACGCAGEDLDTPTQSDGEETEEEPLAPLATTSEDLGSDMEPTTDLMEDSKMTGDHSASEEEDLPSVSEPAGDPSAAKGEAPEGKQEAPAVVVVVPPPQRRASTPPPPTMAVKLLTRLGSLEGPHPMPVKKSPATLPRNFTLPKDPQGSLLRARISTPTGSPHLGMLHAQLPPSCIIEELHRALATKHRQDRCAAPPSQSPISLRPGQQNNKKINLVLNFTDLCLVSRPSFQGKEVRSSPKRRLDARLSRAASVEKEPAGETESKKESDENKENRRLDEYYSDQESWNESVISGTLPRRMRKELLAVKLRNRPSKQELEDRNIFPVRSDQERQEFRQQIELKLAK